MEGATGGVKALTPPPLLNSMAAVEAALAAYFGNPGASSLGPEGETGVEAVATRLTTDWGLAFPACCGAASQRENPASRPRDCGVSVPTVMFPATPATPPGRSPP